MEMKTEIDSNDVTVCPRDDSTATGLLAFTDALFSAQFVYPMFQFFYCCCPLFIVYFASAQ